MTRILLVDGSDAREEALRPLRDWGYALHRARSAQECADSMRHGRPDAALLAMDGSVPWEDCLRLIRTTSPRVPVIGMSPLSECGLRRLLRSRGVNRAEFAVVLRDSPHLEELLMAVERASMPLSGEEPRGSLSVLERKERARRRRRRLEEERLKRYLSAASADDAPLWAVVPDPVDGSATGR